MRRGLTISNLRDRIKDLEGPNLKRPVRLMRRQRVSNTRFICCLTDDHPKVVWELPASLEELDDWQKGRKDIGVAMPQLSPAEMDFLICMVAFLVSLKEIKDCRYEPLVIWA